MPFFNDFAAKFTNRYLLLLLTLPSFFVQADSLSLLKDINTNANSSKLWQPQNGYFYDGKIYFAATDGAHGLEPWIYDLDTQTSKMLLDIETGTSDSSPAGFIAFDDKIFFTANRSDVGEELWVYDLATEQTSLFQNIAADETSSRPRDFVFYNDVLYFIAYREDVGGEIFSLTKGSTEVALLADIKEGSLSSGAGDLVVYDDKLFLGANSGDGSGNELFSISPITGDVRLVADTYAGESSGNVKNLAEFDNKLYFTATNANGSELWVYDSFTDSASQLADIHDSGSSTPDDFVFYGDTLYFSAYSPVSGREVFSYNEIDDINQVTDINSGNESSSPIELIVAEDSIYFSALDSDSGRELWRHTPANSTTELVVDSNVGVSSGNPVSLITDGGQVYFFANDGLTDQLWQLELQTNTSSAIYNGRITTNGSSPTELYVYQDEVYFRAQDQRYGHELHTYDPGPEEVELFADIRSGEFSSNIKEFVEHNGVLYISASNGSGQELYKHSPELADIELALDINPNGSSDFRELYSYQGKLYFTAQDANGNRQLYQYDDVTESLILIELPLNRGDVEIEQIIGFNGHIYVSALVDPNQLPEECEPRELGCDGEEDLAIGEEPFEIGDSDKVLWKIDTQTAQAEMAFALEQGLPVASEFFVELNNKLYFTAAVGMDGLYLLALDSNGVLTKFEDEHNEDTSYNGLFVFQDKLVMGKYTPDTGLELWQFDPSDSSFQLISDINTGEDDSYPWQYAVLDNVLYFNAETAELGEELWSFDGETVQLVADIKLGSESSQPRDLVVVDDSLIFVAEDHNTGREVWRYIPDLAPKFLNPPTNIFTLSEDTTTEQIDLTLHAVDKNGDSIHWAITTPENGIAAIEENTSNSKQIYYQPNQDFNGLDNFIITLTDEAGLSSELQVSVSVSPVNDVPVGFIAIDGETTDGQFLEIITNFVDVDGFQQLSFAWIDSDNTVLSSEPSYQLSQSDVAKSIRGKVFYTDLSGTEEELFTEPFIVEYKKDSDYDGDGLSNQQEIDLGLDIFAADTDGDGVTDNLDVFPLDAAESVDTDGDGIGNNADTDIDGDGVLNEDDANPSDFIESIFDENVNGEDDLEEVFARLTGEVITGYATGVLTDIGDLVDGHITPLVNELGLANIFLISISEGNERASGVSALTVQMGTTLRSVDVDVELNLYPVVYIPAERAVKAGSDVSINIQLSGDAVSYPLEVSYELTSFDTGAVITEGIATFNDGEILFAVTESGLSEGNYGLTLTGVVQGDASLSNMNKVTFITVRERVAPSVEVSAYQGDVQTSLLEQNDIHAYLNFELTGGMEENLNVQVSLDDEVLFNDVATELKAISLDLATLSIDSHEVKTILTSTDANETFEVLDVMHFQLKETLETLSDATDTDGDGVADSEEGYGDSDGDGIADYLDDASLEENEQSLGDSTVAVAEGLTISIGSTLQQVDEGLSEDIGASVEELEESLGIEIDDSDVTEYVLPVLDFEIRGAEIGAAVDMVIPLDNTLVGTEEYRKLTDDGQLVAFDITDGSLISSGLQVSGECPAIAALDQWQNGIVSGNDCIKLTIVDGGTNDADGEANGTIVDPAVLVNVNSAPSITLANNMTADELTQVTVSAEATDEDGQTLAYLWQVLSDHDISLNNADTLDVDFTAPSVTRNEEAFVTLELTVDDGVTTTSQSIDVSIENVNNAPVIELGDTLVVDENTEVTVSAEAADADGETLTYAWEVLSDTDITLANADSLQVRFNSPEVSRDGGKIELQLSVSDGLDTAISTIEIKVKNTNQAPNLSVVQSTSSVNEGSSVLLTIKGSDEDNDDLSIHVVQTQGPQALSLSTPPLNGTLTINAPQVSQDEDYSLELTLSDGIDTMTHVVSFTVLDQKETKQEDGEESSLTLNGGGINLWLILILSMVVMRRLAKV